jgi:hypothetical protein
MDPNSVAYITSLGITTTFGLTLLHMVIDCICGHIVLFAFFCIAMIGLAIKYACELMLAGCKFASEMEYEDIHDLAEFGDFDDSLSAQIGMLMNRTNYTREIENASLEEYKTEFYDKENELEAVLNGVRGSLRSLDRAESLEIEAFKDEFYDEDIAETKRRIVARTHLMKSLGFSDAEKKLASDYHEVIEL